MKILVSVFVWILRVYLQVVFANPAVQALLGVVGRNLMWASTLLDGLMK